MHNQTAFSAAATRRANTRQYSAGKLVSSLNRVWSALSAWRKERAAIAELASLNDRELRDIGLCRSNIVFVARGPRAHERALRRAGAATPARRGATQGSSRRSAPQMAAEPEPEQEVVET